VVQRVRGVIPQGQLRQGHLPTEVLEVVLVVEVHIEALEAALEIINPIEVLHQEAAAIDLQEAEVQVQEVVVIGVPVAALEVLVAVRGVRVVLLDHHLEVDPRVVVDLLLEEVVEDNNSQSYLKYT